MIRALTVCLILWTQVALKTTDPFDQYVASRMIGRPDPTTVHLARQCGLKLAEGDSIYGLRAGERFTKVSNLSKVIKRLEQDNYETAEISKSDDDSKIVRIWSLSLDVGSESEMIGCIDPQGNARVVYTSDWFFPVDGSAPGWGYKREFTVDGHGALICQHKMFADVRGRAIAEPKIDEDIKKSLAWMPKQDDFKKTMIELR